MLCNVFTADYLCKVYLSHIYIYILKLKQEKNASLGKCSYITNKNRSSLVGKFETLNKVCTPPLFHCHRH